jgi:toxin ParE1/3/4
VKPRTVVAREVARRDIDDAIDHYLREAGEPAALDFIAALERAYGHISRNPDAGSPRCASELGLQGLRTWPLKRFPHLVFYVAEADRIDVWRVLHGERDLPHWLREPADGCSAHRVPQP